MTDNVPKRGRRAGAKLGSRSGGDRPEPGARRGAAAFRVSAFARLARAHGAAMGGDALVAVALADSLFFSIDPNDARWRVALYLLLTVAPFGVVAPWLGPAMDRITGGHRFVLIAAAAARAVLAIGMAIYSDSALLFPLAFSMLVMGKTHHIAKSALVPAMVGDATALVRANSRLSIVSSVSAGLAGIPGVLLLLLGGAPATLGLAAIAFLGSAVLGTRIPAVKVAAADGRENHGDEPRGAGVIVAATAMGYLRVVVGFLTMLLAFALKGGIDPGPTGAGVEIGHRVRASLGLEPIDLATGGAPAWHFGLVLVATGVGGLAGAISSPRLRHHLVEEKILAGVLGLVAAFGVLGAIAGGLVGAMMVAFAVAVAGQAGKQSFDAIVQRDTTAADLGQFFSRFETRFQLLWVVGALVPVVLPIPARIGFLFLAAATAFAGVSYWLGRSPALDRAWVDRASRRLNADRDRISRGRRDRRGRRGSP